MFHYYINEVIRGIAHFAPVIWLDHDLIEYRGIFTGDSIICLESKRLLALVVNTNALTPEDALDSDKL